MQNLRWVRVLRDTIFAVGAVTLFVFIVGLLTGRSFVKEESAIDAVPAPAP